MKWGNVEIPPLTDPPRGNRVDHFRGKFRQQFRGRNQRLLQPPLPGEGFQSLERPRGLNLEIAGSRTPKRRKVRPAAGQLAEVVERCSSMRTSPAVQWIRTLASTPSKLISANSKIVTLTGFSSTVTWARASSYAFLPPIFFAEMGGGVCVSSPRNCCSQPSRSASEN